MIDVNKTINQLESIQEKLSEKSEKILPYSGIFWYRRHFVALFLGGPYLSFQELTLQ